MEQQNKTTYLQFNWTMVLCLVVIEVLTIPFVAISNTITVTNPLYMAIMGFIVAFCALILFVKMILPRLKKHLSKILQLDITKISGVLYIGLISGFLLMFMFNLQEITYMFTPSDTLVGLVSGFGSVGASLLIYRLLDQMLNYGVKIITPKQKFLLSFAWKDVIVLTLLFTLYELIACPVSLLWMSHYEHRFWWGILSGILSGVCGGIPPMLICKLTGYKISLNFRSIK